VIHSFPVLVTAAALLVYLGHVQACGKARERFGIAAPAVTGHPEFERRLRIQQNMMEQLALFLPALWLAAATVSPWFAGGFGLVFVAGRIWYAAAYVRDPARRGPGFTMALVGSTILLLGAIAATAWNLLAT
jgi:uncharacterized membrane protein YecN with MAPEG domain